MKNLYALLITFAFISCKSPTELMEAGKYNSAFDKAVAEVKRGKNVSENILVIKASAKIKVDEALNYSSIMTNTEKVKNWIKTQNKVYVLLEDLGKANMALNGLINDSYDSLCDEKKDIDFQIVEYFYDEGHDHLDRFYRQENKVDARNAYKSFKDCEKYEGQSFFPRLAENIEDAYENGIVYYISNYGRIGNKLFLKPLPKDAHFKPDCDINISHGFVSFSTSESSIDECETKKIKTGTEEKTDTSGRITYEPIYEEVSATITTNTITITASIDTYVKINNVTGQCSVNSYAFSTEVSDSFEEISVNGDERALDYIVIESSGEPAFLRRKLEDLLLEEANGRVGI